jgi:predicted amidohydrolase
MKGINVVCCQFRPASGDVKSNRKKIEAMVAESRPQAPQVVVFPEVCVQGISPAETIIKTAENIPGETSKLMCALSKEYNVYCVVGLAESCDGKRFNVALLTGPEGKALGVYRKTHLWTTEREIYSNGTEYPVFDTDFGKVGMWICYDTRFPEVARKLSMKGATTALVPTAWLSRDIEHWKLAVRSRALDNFMYVCGADEILQSDFHQSCGMSLICDPNGNLLTQASPMKEMTISATIDPALPQQLRTSIPVLEDPR